jgi:hypothetical protein
MNNPNPARVFSANMDAMAEKLRQIPAVVSAMQSQRPPHVSFQCGKGHAIVTMQIADGLNAWPRLVPITEHRTGRVRLLDDKGAAGICGELNCHAAARGMLCADHESNHTNVADCMLVGLVCLKCNQGGEPRILRRTMDELLRTYAAAVALGLASINAEHASF